MNKVILIGNLTADPEMRSTGTGVSVCSFRIAIDRKFKDASGNKVTDYIPVTCWRQLADLCGRYLAKGRKVGIAGTLQMRNYEDKSGQKRTAYEVVADEVEFLSPQGSTTRSDADDSAPPSGDFDMTDLDESGLPF